MNPAQKARSACRSAGLARWAVEIVVQDLLDRPDARESDLAVAFCWLQDADFARIMGIPASQAALEVAKALSWGDLSLTKALGLDNRPVRALSPSLDLLFRVHLAEKQAAKAVLTAEHVRKPLDFRVE